MRRFATRGSTACACTLPAEARARHSASEASIDVCALAPLEASILKLGRLPENRRVRAASGDGGDLGDLGDDFGDFGEPGVESEEAESRERRELREPREPSSTEPSAGLAARASPGVAMLRADASAIELASPLAGAATEGGSLHACMAEAGLVADSYTSRLERRDELGSRRGMAPTCGTRGEARRVRGERKK